MKHTKGPWRMETFDRNYKKSKPIHIFGGIFEVAQAVGEDIDTREANAHLIAKAPEMEEEIERLKHINADLLEACKRALPWMGKLIAENLHLQCVKPTDAEKTLTLLQQVISKAEEKEV